MKLNSTVGPLLACRITRLDRDRLNEYIAAGFYPCAPETTPGKSRIFELDDLVGLWLFREMMDDGHSPAAAGYIACKVAGAAIRNPQSRMIAFAQTYFDQAKGGVAFPAEELPAIADFDIEMRGGTDVRKVTIFRVGKIRDFLAHYIEQELSASRSAADPKPADGRRRRDRQKDELIQPQHEETDNEG